MLDQQLSFRYEDAANTGLDQNHGEGAGVEGPAVQGDDGRLDLRNEVSQLEVRDEEHVGSVCEQDHCRQQKNGRACFKK